MAEESNNEAIREQIYRRPGMYFGNVGVQGVERFVYELVSNVLDAYLADRATFVNVELDENTISTIDDGPGLPFDEPGDLDGVSLATQFLTHVHSTRSQNEHAPHVHMTTWGIGLAPLNIASTRFKVQSWRSSLLWEQHFIQGVAQGSATVIEQGNGRGTRIDAIPAPEIFGQAKPRPDIIRKALFETAHLFSGIVIGFHQERFQTSKGLQALGFMLVDPLSISILPNTLPFHVTLHAENILIEVAIFGEKRSRSHIFSWVNGARTSEGGSHVAGVLKILKEIDWKPALILIHVVMFDPEFAGPTHNKLDVPHIQKTIQNALREPLSQYKLASCTRLN